MHRSDQYGNQESNLDRLCIRQLCRTTTPFPYGVRAAGLNEALFPSLVATVEAY